MVELIVMLAATFLGVLTATLFPYLRKKWEGKIENFDIKYVWHLVGTCVVTFAVNIVTYSAWRPPTEFILNDVFILILAFAFGYAGNNGQKGVEKWFHTFQTLSKGIDTTDGG